MKIFLVIWTLFLGISLRASVECPDLTGLYIPDVKNCDSNHSQIPSMNEKTNVTRTWYDTLYFMDLSGQEPKALPFKLEQLSCSRLILIDGLEGNSYVNRFPIDLVGGLFASDSIQVSASQPSVATPQKKYGATVTWNLRVLPSGDLEMRTEYVWYDQEVVNGEVISSGADDKNFCLIRKLQ